MGPETSNRGGLSKMSAPDWDKRYQSAPEGLFGRAPNQYLRAVVGRDDFVARSALCLADGDGRNSRWLALQAIETTAVDASPVAVGNAVALDRAAGAKVERVVADLASWAPAQGRRYDAAFLLYFHGPFDLRMRALRSAWDALTPGGWLILEAFSKAQADRSGGPSSDGHLYDLKELPAVLSGHRVMEALSGSVLLDEGPRHQGLMQVVRFLATKA